MTTFSALFRLYWNSLWRDTFEGLGFGIQRSFDGAKEASLRFFFAIGFVVALRMPRHVLTTHQHFSHR